MKKLLTALVAATLPLTAMSQAPAPRAITVEDLVRLERVQDLRVSPDGRHASYTLRTTDYAANKGLRQLWLLDLKTRASRALTAGPFNNSDARWSADSQTLFFISNRSGSAQVWRLPLEGGEAQPVTALPLDVGSFAVSPTGARIAISLEVFPDCDTLTCNQTRFDELAKKKSTGLLHDKLFARHWDTWKIGTRSQLFTWALSGGKAVGEPAWVSQGIDGDVPSKPFGDDSEYTFSPDGTQIVFAARIAGRTEAWSTNLDLWQVPSDGSAAPKNLTEGNTATDTGPVFSPDGRWLAWRAMKRPTFEADRYGVMLRDLKSGTVREVAATWDRSAETLKFSADGTRLYTQAEDLGQKRVFAIDIASGKVAALTGEGNVSGFGFAGKTLVYTQHSLVSPDQVWMKHGKQAPVALTSHNADVLAQLKLGDYEQFTFKGWNDETVYGHVMKPWNYVAGKKYPVAFIIHGGPQGSMGNDWHYRWNPAVFSGMGFAVVFIDFHGSTGYGQAFTDSISGDWGGKPLEDLQKGWAHALKTYDYLDGTRAAALGASYGGYMINWIAGTWPEAFKALVNHDGIFDNRSMYYSTEELWFDEWEHGGPHFENPAVYEKHNPVQHVTKWKTPMLVIHGEKDYRVPPEQGIATFTALQRRGIPSQLLVFPDENHWVLKPQNSVQWHQTVEAWLKRWTN